MPRNRTKWDAVSGVCCETVRKVWNLSWDNIGAWSCAAGKAATDKEGKVPCRRMPTNAEQTHIRDDGDARGGGCSGIQCIEHAEEVPVNRSRG